MNGVGYPNSLPCCPRSEEDDADLRVDANPVTNSDSPSESVTVAATSAPSWIPTSAPTKPLSNVEKVLGPGSTTVGSTSAIHDTSSQINQNVLQNSEAHRHRMRNKEQHVFGDQDGSGINIVWNFEQDGQNSDGGWRVSDNGMVVKFMVEDSAGCAKGGNLQEQKGTANGILMVFEGEMPLYFALGGMGEMLDSGYESIVLSIDGKVVASATSNGRGQACSSGPARVTYLTETIPIILSAGMHTINLTFTSFDDYDHRGVFYELQFSRTKAAAREIDLHSPYMTLPSS